MTSLRPAGLLALVMAVVTVPLLGRGLPALDQATPTSGKGSIAGRVVDADSNTPLSSVVVTLDNGNAALATLSGGTSSVRVLTDSQGRFAFLNIAKGSYAITATVGGSGFAPSGFLLSGFGQAFGGYLSGAYGQQRPNGPSETLDLGADEHATDLVLRLWKGAAIDGAVYDEANEPLVGVQVAAVQESSDGRLLTGPTTNTDDRGAFHLGALAPGRYLVVVPQHQVVMPTEGLETILANPSDNQRDRRLADSGISASTGGGIRVGSSALSTQSSPRDSGAIPPSLVGDRLFVYQTTFHPAAVSVATAESVIVRSGEERAGVDVHLQPVRSVEVSGRLNDSAGPVANFGVHLLPADIGDGAAVLEVATAATDSRGNFTFPLVPAGAYTLMALREVPVGTGRAAGPAPAPASIADQAGAWASQAIAVADVNVSNVALTLRHGVAISGRVEFQGTRDLPSERIRRTIGLLRAQPLVRAGGPSPSASFAGTGEFRIEGVPPGRWIVRTPVDAYVGWALRSVTIGGRDVTDSVVTVSDADLTDVVVTLTDRPAEVSGTVRGVSGSPDPGAAVFLFPTDTARWADARSSALSFRTVRVSTTGAFRVTNVLQGEYYLVAAPDATAGNWPDVQYLKKLAAIATTIRVDASQKMAVTLKTTEPR